MLQELIDDRHRYFDKTEVSHHENHMSNLVIFDVIKGSSANSIPIALLIGI